MNSRTKCRSDLGKAHRFWRCASSPASFWEVQIAVKKSDTDLVSVTIECAKDIEEGAEIFSRLERVDVGSDPDGDPITSLVVVPADETEAHKIGKALSGANQRALDALFQALLDFGSVPPASSHIPAKLHLSGGKSFFWQK
jgi:hypothetical protein